MKNIRKGSHYSRYFNKASYIFKEIPAPEDCKEAYIIQNKIHGPIFRAHLYVFPDGRAKLQAKYTTYSGVNNSYMLYFDNEGYEIIHMENHTPSEKKLFDSLKYNIIENFNEHCPENTKCRRCKAYHHTPDMGADNYEGSSTEVGYCRYYGHTYGQWIGRNNSKKRKKDENK